MADAQKGLVVAQQDMLAMKLSEHFTLAEMTRTSTGLPNVPPESALPLVRELCEKVLEPVRDKWGPLRITSGYRSPAVNSAVGGSATSSHVWSEDSVACDFQSIQARLEDVFEWLRLESSLDFDQAILEYGRLPDSTRDDCIHIGFRSHNPRRLAMVGQTNNRSKYQYVEVV